MLSETDVTSIVFSPSCFDEMAYVPLQWGRRGRRKVTEHSQRLFDITFEGIQPSTCCFEMPKGILHSMPDTRRYPTFHSDVSGRVTRNEKIHRARGAESAYNITKVISDGTERII